MIDGKSVLAIIPARGGSKGIPRKNIKDLCGKPLIAWTIEALKSKYIDRTIVSTEDEEIAEISKKYGAEIPFLRPKELAEDNTPTVDVVVDLINWLERYEGYKYDYVCVLQCTSPFRKYLDIDKCLEKIETVQMDGIVSICEVATNPYWTNIFEGYRLKYFIEEGRSLTRRQQLPKVYRYNGAIYIVRKEALIKQKTLEPENMTGYIMSKENSIDIDDMIDFKLAEILIKECDNNA